VEIVEGRNEERASVSETEAFAVQGTETARKTPTETEAMEVEAFFPGTQLTFAQVRELCRHDKALFSLLFFPHHVIPSVGVPEFHKEIYAAFDDHSHPFTLILAPRGFAKTTLAFIDTMHDIAYHLEEFIILASKTLDMARQYMFKVKYELEGNRLFIATYGDMVPRSKLESTWTKNDIICRNGVRVRAIGAGNQIRGINYGPYRPSKIVLDDPEDIRSVDSEEERENIRRWFQHDVTYCLSQGVQGGQKRGRILVIGNLIHSDCLVARLQNDSRFHTLYYQAIVKEEGEERSLWPEYFPLEDLLKEKAQAAERGETHIFMMERMNISMAPEERLARESDLREWDGSFFYREGRAVIQWGELTIPVEVVTAVDLATREKRTSDFTVILTIGVDSRRNVYLLEYWRFREANPIKRFVALMLQVGRYHPVGLAIESVSAQQDFARMFQYLRESKEILKAMLEEQEIRQEDIGMVLRCHIPVVQELPTRGKSKISRILSNLQPLFRMHMIHHKPSMQDFKLEATNFPETKHDDIVDALEMACSIAHAATVETVVKKEKPRPRSAYCPRYSKEEPREVNLWTR